MKDKEFIVRQISVFLDNRPGSLAEMARYLAKKDINLRALSLAETRDFGTARLIVADTAHCVRALREGGYNFMETDVLAVEVADRPGGMADVLEIIADEQINVEYVYATVGRIKESAVIILRVEDPGKAGIILRSKGIKLLGEKDIELL
ncbi:MAG: ACT domain-containing protein [Deltaproteobacteria bacterium]|nr:ACT domain-containing protein [Deltaproteobacteria bacterium]